jgi:hypothetical protein
MSGDDFSGESNGPITVRTVGDAQTSSSLPLNDDFLPVVTVSSSGVRTTASARSFRNPQLKRKARGKAHTTQEVDRHLPEDRDAIRRLWRDAQRKAGDMVLASKCGDPIELSNATSDLDHLLSELWRLRECRESDWRGVLDFLQGVLRYTWKIDGGYEVLSEQQCTTIELIVREYLGPSTMDSESVENTLEALQAAGFDPWVGISFGPKA